MTQSTHSRLNDYETLLANSNVHLQPNLQSNVTVNPIGEFVNSMPNYMHRTATQQQNVNYYPTYQSAYSRTNQNLQSNSNIQIQSNLQSSLQPKFTANTQQATASQNEWTQPVSNSSSSTASTALLQTTPFQSTLTPSGLSTQLIIPPKLTTSKLKSNSITIWPINRNKTNQSGNARLNNCTNVNQQSQLISKLKDRSSFTHNLLTCALISGIITLLIIVFSSVYIYSTYTNRVLKSAKLNEKEICSQIECYFGARCKVDLALKQPYCDCELFQCDSAFPVRTTHHSSSNRSQAVCGSDNRSYATLCELRQASCSRQKRIEIVQHSACVNKHSDGKLGHPNNKSANDKGKETLFTNLFGPDISADVNILLNNPLAKQEACNQLGCSFTASCQIRNVSLSSSSSSFITSIAKLDKKATRLVCECPAKCSMYEHLITELVAEANVRITELIQQQGTDNSSFDHKPNGEYYASLSSSSNHPSSTFNYGYMYEQMRNSLSTAQSGAVCGSNARDYKNLCELAKSSCASQTRISIKYFGLCDPCASHRCAEEEICKLKPNRQPYCDCGHRKGQCSKPQKYQNNPEHVCGSDGNTYLNRCVLQRHTCVNERNVTIISNSECIKGFHPCHKIHCNAEMECRVSSITNQASCECSQHCSAIYKPVCGTDNRTYDSSCFLLLETCLRGNSQPRLGLLHAGVCGTSSLSKPTTSNQANRNHPLIVINEEEHGNVINQLTSLQSNGNQQCAPNTCANHGICLLAFVNGVEKITCECPTCSLTRSLSYVNGSLGTQTQEKPNSMDNSDGPVCGSDSVSYASECELRKFSCEQQKHITIKHKGACRGCEQLKCKNYALCETTSSGASECVCPEACEKLDAPVCGSDEMSYENECELRVSSCKLQKQILVRSVGPCNICEKIKCKYGATCKNGRCTCPTYCDKQSEIDDLLCANNGRTFANDCDLKRYACLHQIELHVVHLGECELESTKKLNSTSLNDSHRDESVEAGVRLVNDEENEDEFNVILRQQSAEDESNAKNLKKLPSSSHKSKQRFNTSTSHHNSSHHSAHNKHNRHHHNYHKQQLQQHSSSKQSVTRKHRNQLCRKLRCKYGANCKFDHRNSSKVPANDSVKSEELNVKLNRISLEVTAYCDCSHINCDLSDLKDKKMEVCASDGKLYYSDCQIKEKSCKLQKQIELKQRDFCDSNQQPAQIDSPVIKVNESTTKAKAPPCSTGFYPEKTENEDNFDSTKSTTMNKQSVNQVNELDLLFDNYVVSSDSGNFESDGCVPCECNAFGSIDEHCDQTTGACRCKHGVRGDKCNYCDEGKELTEYGCVSNKIAKPILGHCLEINCKYGAKCELVGQTAQCKCVPLIVCGKEYDMSNLLKSPREPSGKAMICGSNQIKYPNGCELKMHMCLLQEQIDVKKCL